MRIPGELTVTLDVRADDTTSICAALQATAEALRQDLGPNTIWGKGYCVGIKVGRRPNPLPATPPPGFAIPENARA